MTRRDLLVERELADKISVTLYRSEIDGAAVVQIDTAADLGRLRVNLNDGEAIWDADPETGEPGINTELSPCWNCASRAIAIRPDPGMGSVTDEIVCRDCVQTQPDPAQPDPSSYATPPRPDRIA